LLAGSVPLTVAVFVSTPASTSAWVTVYEPVQVTDSLAATIAIGAAGVQVKLTAGSVTVRSVSDAAPIFVATMVKRTVSPTPVKAVGEATFEIAKPGSAGITVVVVEPCPVTVSPVGEVPVAIAVFPTAPASISAAVTV
jgi:hypothetical protein